MTDLRRNNLFPFFVLGWVVALFGVVAAIASHRCLYADGGSFFLLNAASGQMSEWDWFRQFAHYISQGPMELAQTMGVQSFAVLSYLYGFGLFFMPLLLLLPAAWYSAERRCASFLLAAAVFLHVQLNASMFIISEAHIALSLALCVFFYLYHADFTLSSPSRQRIATDLCMCALAVLSTRAYESFFIVGPFWMCLVALLLRSKSIATRWHMLVVGFIGLQGFIAAIIGIWAMAFNTGRTAGDAHLSTIVSRLAMDAGVWLSSLIVAYALTTALRRTSDERSVSLSLVGANFIVGIGLGLLSLSTAFATPPDLHYPARLFALIWPMALFALLVWRRGHGPLQPRRGLVCAVVLLLSWTTTWHCVTSFQWLQYRRQMYQELQAGPMFLPLGNTVIANNPLNWDWAIPALSLDEQALHGGPLKRVIGPDPRHAFEPFNPRDPATWPDLRAYHIENQATLTP